MDAHLVRLFVKLLPPMRVVDVAVAELSRSEEIELSYALPYPANIVVLYGRRFLYEHSRTEPS